LGVFISLKERKPTSRRLRHLNKETSKPKSGVVNLDDARARLRPRGGGIASHEVLSEEMAEVRTMLDQGMSSAAETRLHGLIKAAQT
jgi:hypothetical protein